MTKNLKVIVGLGVFAVILAAGYDFIILNGIFRREPASSSQEKNQASTNTGSSSFQPQTTSLSQAIVPSNEKNALLLLIFDETNLGMFEAEAKEKMTVFDLLKKGTEELKLDLQTKDYKDMGIFIEKIGEKKNGEQGKYWLYYVNGQAGQVAADKLEIKAGDKVEWRFDPIK